MMIFQMNITEVIISINYLQLAKSNKANYMSLTNSTNISKIHQSINVKPLKVQRKITTHNSIFDFLNNY